MKNINFRRFLSAVLAVVMISTVALTASVPAFAIDETAIETAPEATPAPPAETAAPMPEETPMDPPAEDIPDDTHRPSDDLDLDVFARTLTIGDNVQINYAVADMGYDNVKMLFFTGAQTEYTFENADLSVDWSYRDNVLGQKAYVFSYTELFDTQMTDVIYSRAYVEYEGEYTYGEVNKYSVLQYAYNKTLYGDAGAELEATLEKLLERGAKAQLADGYKTDDLANEPHSQVHVVEDVMEDGFADFLLPDTKEVGEIDKYLITTNGDIFYVVDGENKLGYQLIEGYMYYFDEGTGAKKNVIFENHEFDKKGHIVADHEFVEINGNTYYFVDNRIVTGYYVIDIYIYFFLETGVMLKNSTVDGYDIDADGKLIADKAFIDTGDNVYYVVDSVVVLIYIYIDGELYLDIDGRLIPTVNYDSTVFESDSDEDVSNNNKLPGVQCKATIEELGITFVVTTDENGNFVFPFLPRLHIIFVFIINGYIDGSYEIDLGRESISIIPSIILDKNVSNSLAGKITIADTDTDFGNNASLEGARVDLERISSLNRLFKTTYTDANGNYSFGELTAGVYRLTVIINGYITIDQTVNIRDNQTNVQNSVIEAIPDTGDVDGAASGVIKDARTGNTIAGLKVVIRAGLNNITGDILATVFTDLNGLFLFEGLRPGNYTAQIIDERELDDEDYRFGSIVIFIKVIGGVTINNQNGTSSNNIGLDLDGMRIVLTWGSRPYDLDSHMEANTTNGNKHIYFGNQSGMSMNLDVDDISSYGPETTTVEQIYDGTYKFYVHDYTNRNYSGNTALSASGAKVEVYLGSNVPAYTLYVPEGRGTYWDVFTYDSTTGLFTIHNSIR